ncbi:MAG: hypothetical protein WA733_24455 [Methylocystis sp.]
MEYHTLHILDEDGASRRELIPTVADFRLAIKNALFCYKCDCVKGRYRAIHVTDAKGELLFEQDKVLKYLGLPEKGTEYARRP